MLSWKVLIRWEMGDPRRPISSHAKTLISVIRKSRAHCLLNSPLKWFLWRALLHRLFECFDFDGIILTNRPCWPTECVIGVTATVVVPNVNAELHPKWLILRTSWSIFNLCPFFVLLLFLPSQPNLEQWVTIIWCRSGSFGSRLLCCVYLWRYTPGYDWS